jgi:hypothetical protein
MANSFVSRPKHFKMTVSHSLTGWLIMSGIGLSNAYAQEGIRTAGGEASGTGGTVSYSVGQVAYLEASGPGGTSSPGTQQPLAVSVLSATSSATKGPACTAYPNPASSTLTLRVDDQAAWDLSWQLTNLRGQQLAGQHLNGPLTSISLLDFAAGIYFLTVSGPNQPLKTFKIIKP